jgi:hypothetical protein
VLKDFYLSFSAVCFTLLGLWLIVVQRHVTLSGGEVRWPGGEPTEWRCISRCPD